MICNSTWAEQGSKQTGFQLTILFSKQQFVASTLQDLEGNNFDSCHLTVTGSYHLLSSIIIINYFTRHNFYVTLFFARFKYNVRWMRRMIHNSTMNKKLTEEKSEMDEKTCSKYRQNFDKCVWPPWIWFVKFSNDAINETKVSNGQRMINDEYIKCNVHTTMLAIVKNRVS